MTQNLTRSLGQGRLNQSPSRRVLVTKHLRIVVTKSKNGSYQIGESQFPKHRYQIGDSQLRRFGFQIGDLQFRNHSFQIGETQLLKQRLLVSQPQFPKRSFQIVVSKSPILIQSVFHPEARNHLTTHCFCRIFVFVLLVLHLLVVVAVVLATQLIFAFLWTPKNVCASAQQKYWYLRSLHHVARCSFYMRKGQKHYIVTIFYDVERSKKTSKNCSKTIYPKASYNFSDHGPPKT